METVDEVLGFWLDEVGPSGWYRQDDDLDARIEDRLGRAIDRARDGALALWLTYPKGTLAYILLTDQFTRNVYRDTRRAFELDPIARAASKVAIGRRWDMRIDEPGRQFFYMPLVHSENLPDQSRGVRLMATRMRETGAEQLLHARAHREVIRRYGRFPHRNAALGRETTFGERDFLAAGGYASVVEGLREAA